MKHQPTRHAGLEDMACLAVGLMVIATPLVCYKSYCETHKVNQKQSYEQKYITNVTNNIGVRTWR